tara:strand:- start:20586 stop:20774 length:189 start_codon:yes stop_codon:yes gene_type:complete
MGSRKRRIVSDWVQARRCSGVQVSAQWRWGSDVSQTEMVWNMTQMVAELWRKKMQMQLLGDV